MAARRRRFGEGDLATDLTIAGVLGAALITGFLALAYAIRAGDDHLADIGLDD